MHAPMPVRRPISVGLRPIVWTLERSALVLLRPFGVHEVIAGDSVRSPEELRALVEHEVARARRLFAAAAPAVAAAPAAVRPGIRLACAVYESVLDRVEAAGYDVLGRRMGVRLWRLPLLAFGALRP